MDYKIGITRFVFLIGSFAIKIPRFSLKMTNYGHSNFLQGCLANWKERMNYIYFKSIPEIQPLMVPSIWCSWFGLIQVQRRAEPLRRELTKVEANIMSKICTDLKSVNFGIYEGNLVCLDYGD